MQTSPEEFRLPKVQSRVLHSTLSENICEQLCEHTPTRKKQSTQDRCEDLKYLSLLDSRDPERSLDNKNLCVWSHSLQAPGSSSRNHV
jgi:hypothetical protein